MTTLYGNRTTLPPGISGTAPRLSPPAQPPTFDCNDGHATADVFTAQVREQAQARGGTINPFTMPFRVQLEMKVKPDQAQRWLNGTQWTVSAIHGNSHVRGGDCSHKRDGGGSSFVRLHSPSLTVEGGAFRQIADVLKRMKDGGARTGRTGAMRILVRDVQGSALVNLSGTQITHEDILYRLARGGGRGRRLGNKFKYARPLSRQLSGNETVDYQIRGATHNKYMGMNHSNGGEIEFRYFDSTLKAPAVQANVAMVLGMMAAANDGRLKFEGRHPVRSFGLDFIVGANRWNKFMRETVGDGPIQQQLKRQFHRSHGVLV